MLMSNKDVSRDILQWQSRCEGWWLSCCRGTFLTLLVSHIKFRNLGLDISLNIKMLQSRATAESDVYRKSNIFLRNQTFNSNKSILFKLNTFSSIYKKLLKVHVAARWGNTCSFSQQTLMDKQQCLHVFNSTHGWIKNKIRNSPFVGELVSKKSN